MIFVRIFSMTLQSLWIHRVRSTLAITGILISVAMMAFLLSVMFGFKQTLVAQINAVGAEEMVAVPAKLLNGPDISHAGLSQLSQFTSLTSTLTWKDVQAVQQTADRVVAAAPQYEEIERASAIPAKPGVPPGRPANVILTGTTAAYAGILHYPIRQGRFLQTDDVDNHRKVIVLGDGAAQLLFPGGDAIGRSVHLAGETFAVVGVMQSKTMIGFNFDERVYIPVSVFERITNVHNAAMLFFAAASAQDVPAAMNQTVRIIARVHGTDDFGMITAGRTLHILDNVMLLLNALTAGITGVSLVVGGISIMNVMLMAVRERTSEIGIRQAIGASRGAIGLQFLLESWLLALIGAAAGIASAYAGLYALHTTFPILPAMIPSTVTRVCLGAAFLVGLVFGCYPAVRAAGIQPAVALRGE
jgi:putative ABC transport system permease protein